MDLNIFLLDILDTNKSLSILHNIFNIRILHSKGVWISVIPKNVEYHKSVFNNLTLDLDDDFLIIDEINDSIDIWDAYRIGESHNEMIYTKIASKKKNR